MNMTVVRFNTARAAPASLALALTVAIGPGTADAEPARRRPDACAKDRADEGDRLTVRSEARNHLERARRAAAAGEWDLALAEFARSSALEPSVAAAEGLARAHDARQEQAAALRAYEALLREYASVLGAAVRRNIEARIEALQRSTGSLSFQVEPSGARVELDGVYLGTTPLPAPVRADAGSHRVEVKKAGLRAVDLSVTVVAGATVTASATLAPATPAALAPVTPATLAPATPATLAPVTPATPAPVTSPTAAPSPGGVLGTGGTATTTAHEGAVTPIASVPIDLSVLDRHGTIAIDGRVVGEGDYRGEAPAGPHVIRVTRPGYAPFEKRVVLVVGTPFADVVILVPSPAPAPVWAGGSARASGRKGSPGPTRFAAPKVESDEVRVETSDADAMHGTYGGVIAEWTLQPGGTHGDVCSVPGVTRCSMSDPIGGGILGYVGHMADPVGLDVLFGVQGDASTVTATAAGQTATVVIPRVGGILALRGRLAWQTSAFRFSMSAGLGTAFRAVGLVAGGLSTSTYWAPAVTADGALRFRLARGAALSVGLMFWGENVENSVLLQVKPLPTSVHVLRSTQALVMPFVGIEFGP